jgi:hypothetical protein
MMRISTTMIAMTSKIWINPPRVYDVIIPSSQRMSKSTAIVTSIKIFYKNIDYFLFTEDGQPFGN